MSRFERRLLVAKVRAVPLWKAVKVMQGGQEGSFTITKSNIAIFKQL